MVVRLSEFVGKNLPDAAIDAIVEKVTFNNMKQDDKANYTNLPNVFKDSNSSQILRKGKQRLSML